MFLSNSDDHIQTQAAATLATIIVNNLFYKSATGSGFRSVDNTRSSWYLYDNVFALNNQYGIEQTTGMVPTTGMETNNAFYSNGQGDVLNFARGKKDVTLTSLPFVDTSANVLNFTFAQKVTRRWLDTLDWYSASPVNFTYGTPGPLVPADTASPVSVDPGVNNVINQRSYTINNAALTGTYDTAHFTSTDPGQNKVIKNVTYKIYNVNKTGSFDTTHLKDTITVHDTTKVNGGGINNKTPYYHGPWRGSSAVSRWMERYAIKD
jgi:hypothetical protein